MYNIQVKAGKKKELQKYKCIKKHINTDRREQILISDYVIAGYSLYISAHYTI